MIPLVRFLSLTALLDSPAKSPAHAESARWSIPRLRFWFFPPGGIPPPLPLVFSHTAPWFAALSFAVISL